MRGGLVEAPDPLGCRQEGRLSAGVTLDDAGCVLESTIGTTLVDKRLHLVQAFGVSPIANPNSLERTVEAE
jgi:hypothetical protein